MRKLIVLTGAGISAESGLKTFRDMGGLWELYDVTQVASPVAWENNRELVLRFYNERRKQLLEVQPNAGHRALAELEKWFEVKIITQNVDDLHERAGSTDVLHLHGELRKARSTADPKLIYDIDGWELKEGDRCELGSQLRPHVVWFGEPVTNMPLAIMEAREADIFLIVGTSLVVYPAAGLVDYVPSSSPLFLVDPNDMDNPLYRDITIVKEPATTGIEKVKAKLITNYAEPSDESP